MKKILLPTDFSENSWNAITYALQLFKDEVCKFYLLNTYTPIIYHEEYILGSPAQYDLEDTISESSMKQLKTMKKRMETEFKNPNHTVTTLSVFNTLVPEIETLVNEEHIDYVVMGTKGATGAKEILFGSNTVHVFKKATCPILAIPEGFEFEAPHDLLFPTDYEVTYTNDLLKPLFDIVALFTTRINILHVTYGYGLTEAQKTNKKTLEKFFAKTAHLFHSVANETVQEAITEFQWKVRVNILAMINNKHSFFENLLFKSTINQIGFHLNIPFLLIPTPKK